MTSTPSSGGDAESSNIKLTPQENATFSSSLENQSSQPSSYPTENTNTVKVGSNIWFPSLPRLGLKLKFTLITTIIFLAIFVTSSFILIKQNIDFQKSTLLSEAKTFSVLATKPLGDSYELLFHAGNLKFRDNVRSTLILDKDITRVQIVSVEGDLLFDSIFLDNSVDVPPESQITEKSILEAVTGDKVVEIKGEGSAVEQIVVPYFNEFGGRPFSVRYFISYDSVNQNIDRAIITIVLLSLVAFLMALFSANFLVNQAILNPLGRIINAAREIRLGNLHKKIELRNKDELGDLAISLNQMATTLSKNIDALKQLDSLKDEFIYLASHNLRTPLTIIKDYLPALQKEGLSENGKKLVAIIYQASGQLEQITESLLNLVSLEKEKKPLIKVPVDVTEIVREASDTVGDKVAEKRVSFIFEFPSEPIQKVKLDRARIKQALVNIIDNAVKFNREGGKVIIKVEQKGKDALVTISDTGIGISKEDSEKIFQKFHRATDVLTYDYGGIGLGLYLAKIIIESHQGKIWFESVPREGTTVHISLPLSGE